jgi:O-antigen/teichoic acid export membrane protein
MSAPSSILDAPAGQRAPAAESHVSAFARLLRLTRGNHMLAAMDQSVVSATSFLTLIMVARWTDAGQLGWFVIGNSVIGVLSAVQHALVATPYAVQRHRGDGCARERAFSCLVQSGLFASVALAPMLLVQAVFAGVGASTATTVLLWAVIGAVPFVLLREFARELAFANFTIGRVLLMDIAAAVIQPALLLALADTHHLSSAAALAAIGVSNGIPALVWLYCNRGEFAYPHSRLKPLLLESWSLGKWLVLSRSAILVQGYAGYWVTVLLAGAATTGVYAACTSIVSFSNPILFGLYNFLTPRAALTLKQSGNVGLRKTTFADTLLLGCLMGAFAVAVAIGGDWLLALLYPSSEYGGYGHVAVILALAALVAAVGIPPSNALASLEKGRAIAAISVGTALLQVLMLVLLLPRMGLVGAAIAAVIGGGAATAVRWTVFLCIGGEPSAQKPTAVQVATP